MHMHVCSGVIGWDNNLVYISGFKLAKRLVAAIDCFPWSSFLSSAMRITFRPFQLTAKLSIVDANDFSLSWVLLMSPIVESPTPYSVASFPAILHFQTIEYTEFLL